MRFPDFPWWVDTTRTKTRKWAFRIKTAIGKTKRWIILIGTKTMGIKMGKCVFKVFYPLICIRYVKMTKTNNW